MNKLVKSIAKVVYYFNSVENNRAFMGQIFIMIRLNKDNMKINPFDTQFYLHLFLQSPLMFAKTNEDRTVCRKSLYSIDTK